MMFSRNFGVLHLNLKFPFQYCVFLCSLISILPSEIDFQTITDLSDFITISDNNLTLNIIGDTSRDNYYYKKVITFIKKKMN